MRNIINFFIKKPIWANAIIALVLMFGLWSLFSLNSSFFPELDPNQINISVAYPGASPKEMEDGITIKIEQAVKGLQDIEHIDASSSENFATISIQAYSDANMDDLLSDVENAVNSINSFPAGAEKPIITRLKTNGMSSVVAFVGVTAKDPSIKRTDLAEMANKIERDLLNTKVITQITKQGFPEKEISINIRENDLLRYNISMEEIAAKVGALNNDITAGMIRGGAEEMSIRYNSRTTNVRELGEFIIRTMPSGESVRLKDIADVTLGFAEDSQTSTFNGSASISFQIEKTLDEDLSMIAEEVYAYKDKFNQEHEDYSFEVYYEFDSLLKQRIDLLTENGMFGLVLVLLALGLFLNVRLSAWVAFGIPFSFLGMFILGMTYGITINMISLFGMILVVGILVDDGIVIAENIYSHYEKGKSASKAAIDGTMEVLPSVFTSVLTTIVAFSVLLFVEGLEMMREMAFVVISCLVFSLVEAFFVLPSHLASKKVLNDKNETSIKLPFGILLMVLGVVLIYFGSYLLPSEVSYATGLIPFTLMILGAGLFYYAYTKSPAENGVRKGINLFIRFIRDKAFADMLQMFMGMKWKKAYRLSFFFPFAFVISVIILFNSGKIAFTFFPNIPPDFFNVEVAYTPGDNKAQTDQFLKTATQILLEENERIIAETGDTMLTYYTTNIGATMNIGQAGNHTGMLSIYYEGEDAKYPVDTLMNRITRRVRATDIGKLSNEIFVGSFGRFGADIEFGLSSQDNAELEMAKEMFRTELENKKGVANVKDNMPPGRQEVFIELLPQAEIYGIGKSQVIAQIRNGFFGREAQRIIIGNDEVKIWVRYPQQDRSSLSDLKKMRIKMADGTAVPLTSIASFSMGRGPVSLKRRDGQRQVKVDAKCLFPDSVAVFNQAIIKDIIPKVEALHPSVSFSKLGQFERSQKTGNSMAYMTMIVLVVMIMIVMLHFTSLYQAFLIMLVIPAGIAGAILGHGIVGIPVSILSLFGMIALLGVLINDAVVFLDRHNQLIEEGYTSRAAVYEAAISRFRPILLTTITTVSGLLPLIAEKSMQAQFLIPMAVSIAFGVLFGTFFILLCFPVAILFGNDVKRTFHWLRKGELVSHEEIETANKVNKHIEAQEL
ncbi:Multidrug efflux pump subunit AcrB [Lishizhenia tianjinensis]|uniref:Multidrug efflux pump subunit AcrB n=1 Tax=Lishizhenia tianjinensis TaxID=477690 RepID=A0A1I7AGZ7_9FLAO|nr:efflux RND transporter permease subunit [Lishizhenia tianjinensis]SFT74219.1 Multidrug efflux pump subunit AcrB [Lishizhenia tianjinensis]